MSDLTLTATRLFEGVWEGVLTASGADGNYQPEIEVTHLGKVIEDISVTEDEAQGFWAVRVPVPMTALSDGVQTFLITDLRTGGRLNSFTILAGEPLSDDIRVEMDLLRGELDMLKKAFRRHCVETM
ncbi:MAG: hypothetical protein COB39_01710 [Marinosulfonomonas sp.]|nr:MAG: hypothetical protein COB39_01710 [Marinosulfonomonas sp.]